ncbi:MAG: hypothetical protein NC350_03550 [Corallococcus sp.]|nr:hypothetical protein [Corallococcus sp.]
MSTVNYSLKSKGVRLIDARDAWVIGKNGQRRLSSKYSFVGKIDLHMSNMIISAADNKKPIYKGDVSELNRTAKKQIVDHFFAPNGKRNKRIVAYFGIEKKK